MGRDGDSPRMSGMFFKAVVQLFIIFGAETWVVTPLIGREFWGVPTQGCMTDHGEAEPADIVRNVGLPYAGYNNSGSEV